MIASRGEQLRAGGKKVSGEMAPQLARAIIVGRLLPAPQRLGVPVRQSRVGSKVEKQPRGFEPRHVAAIPPLGILIKTWQQAHLGHRKRLGAERNMVARELDGGLKWRRL